MASCWCCYSCPLRLHGFREKHEGQFFEGKLRVCDCLYPLFYHWEDAWCCFSFTVWLLQVSLVCFTLTCSGSCRGTLCILLIVAQIGEHDCLTCWKANMSSAKQLWFDRRQDRVKGDGGKHHEFTILITVWLVFLHPISVITFRILYQWLSCSVFWSSMLFCAFSAPTRPHTVLQVSLDLCFSCSHWVTLLLHACRKMARASFFTSEKLW